MMMMKSDLKCTQNSKKKTAVDISKRYSNVSAKTLSFFFYQLLRETFRDITCVLCTVTIRKKLCELCKYPNIASFCLVFFFCPYILRKKKKTLR